jgi:hypothetical protein
MKVRFRKRKGLLTAGLFVVTGSWEKYDRVSQRKGRCFVLEPCNERLGGQRAILIRKRSSGSRLKLLESAGRAAVLGPWNFLSDSKTAPALLFHTHQPGSHVKGMEIYAKLPMQKSGPNLVYGMR